MRCSRWCAHVWMATAPASSLTGKLAQVRCSVGLEMLAVAEPSQSTNAKLYISDAGKTHTMEGPEGNPGKVACHRRKCAWSEQVAVMF